MCCYILYTNLYWVYRNLEVGLERRVTYFCSLPCFTWRNERHQTSGVL